MYISDFIDIQRKSFTLLLRNGIIKELAARNPILDPDKELELIFFSEFYRISSPRLTAKEAIIKTKTYASNFYVPALLTNKKKKEIVIQWVILGSLPLMSKRGHFIINGSPRIVVNQILRSPGIYFQENFEKKKKIRKYYADLISRRGTWLRLYIDKKNLIWARMKNTPKIPILVFLQAMGVRRKTIFNSIPFSNFFLPKLKKKKKKKKKKEKKLIKTTKQALSELYSITHPQEKNPFRPKEVLPPPDPVLGHEYLFRKFFNPKTYDLSEMGRIRLNLKLGNFIPETITTLTSQDVLCAVNYLVGLIHGMGEVDDIDHLKNRRVRASGEILQNQFNIAFLRLESLILEKFQKKKIKKTVESLITTKAVNGTLREFFGSSQLSQFMDQTNPLAEITHKRRLTSLGPDGITRETAGIAIRGIHPTHYGRICPIETPEGSNVGLVNSITSYAKLNCNGFLETPFYRVYKGQIQKRKKPVFLSAAEEEGFFLAPSDLMSSPLYFLPEKEFPIRLRKEIQEFSQKNLDFFAISKIQMISIATSLIPFMEHNDANRSLMGSNMQRQAVPLLKPERPIVRTGLEARVIADSGYSLQSPIDGFLSHVCGRKIVIENFFYQEKKFLSKEKKFFYNPKKIIQDGNENFFSDYKKILSKKTKKEEKTFFKQNILTNSPLKKSPLKNFFGKKKSKLLGGKSEVLLQNFERTNQETYLQQRPALSEGGWVESGDFLADGSTSENGEVALGKNLLIAYLPWEGYNFEDAVLINERLVYEDVCSSIHIERVEIEIRETKFGVERITKEIPNISENKLWYLDNNGIAIIGSWVKEGDIIVGKVSPIEKKTLSPHEKLLYDIVGMEIPTERDTSLRAGKGVKGRVINVEILEAENLSQDVKFSGPGRVHVYIAEKRKIQVGDKIAGRHGNKGIISKILPRQDMPYLPDGRSVDIVLNPLGVPSRMNVGQVFECLLGLAGIFLHEQYKIIPFDEISGPEASRSLVYSKLYSARRKTGKKWLFDPKFPGKMQLFNGCTGISFDQKITVGQAYILKLIHLVDEKIHARSTGPYSLVTQQPLRGRSKQGGQRLGEMEVWALEGFGVAYILQELLTIKSDDMKGRHQVLDAIFNNKSFSLATPEAFKVLVSELQSLCLKIKVFQVSPFDFAKKVYYPGRVKVFKKQ